MTPLLASLGLFDYSVITVIAIFLYVFSGGGAQRSDVRRLERKLDALLKHQDITLPPVVSKDVQKILREEPDKKLEAIKLHQEQSGLSDADATADVEAYLENQPKSE